MLTTNRPDALEPALAARPGRVDLAIEIPLPDAAARRRLLELYSHGLTSRSAPSTRRWPGRRGRPHRSSRSSSGRASVAALESGRTTVSGADFDGALDELLEDTGALTRVLLGHAQPGETSGTTPSHEWMERIARGEPHHG